MSLESQIADLVASTNNLVSYFNTKKTGIDSAVAAALAAIPDTSRTWWVDQVAGLDTNVGNTREAPFKTIEKALRSTPKSGACTINLLSDYLLDYQILSTCAFIYINGALATSRPKFKTKYFQVTTDGNTFTYLGGFLFQEQATTFEMLQVDIEFPTSTGLSPAPTSERLCSFLRTNSNSRLPALLGITLETLTITMTAPFFGSLIGVSTTPIALNANAVTVPSGFGGKYVSGVASGTDPKNLTYVLTNLSAL